MDNLMDVVDRYVEVWNEPSADERHKRICSLWAPDRTTCYRLKVDREMVTTAGGEVDGVGLSRLGPADPR